MGPKMPVSLVCETQTDLSSAIRSSLSAGLNNGTHNGLNSLTADSNGIQDQLMASAKRAFLSKIEYEEVINLNNSVQDTLKSKYIVLKPPTSTITNAPSTATLTTSSNSVKILINGSVLDKSNNGTALEKKGAELPTPKHVLYAREKVQIGWKNSDRKWIPGAGMINVGNTCYLNSTLQALFHVPAFANWLVSDVQHRESCEEKTGIQGGCIICAMAKTLIASQQSNSQAIKPYLIYSKLRSVCKHLVFGQQEDAHEFLRYLMEAMEKAYLSRFPKSSQLDQYSKETTPINQILGGYLKTSVRCLACGHVSVTFSHFEDLLLDIRKANTLEEALDLYFARERLEDMGYKCESCKKKVSATKQFSLERAPISLCIQLKRFSIVGNKLNKHITVRQHLNLSKYSSRKCPNDQQLNYRLVSMITHLGASQHCGHYTAIGLTEAGSYYQFDDSYVRQIPVQNVLNTNAYIMFYELDTSAGKSQSPLAPTECNKFSTNGERIRPYLGPSQNSITTTVTSTTSPRFIGPLLPTNKLLANSNGDSSSMSPTTHENGTENTAKDTLSSSASLMSSLNSTEKSTSNFVNKANLGSKLVHSFRKVETSPTCKLTSNGAIYNTNTANSSTDTSSQASKTSLLQCNGYEPKKVTNQDSSSSEDDQDNDEDDFDNDKGSMLNTKMLPTLPSMPKLETPPESTENNEKTVSDSTTGSSSGTQSKMKNTLLPKPAAFMKGTSSLYANGKTGDQKNREPDSDSSDSDDYSSKPSFMSNAKHTVNKAVATKAKSSIPILLNNGNSRQHKLVPYDDSEYDSGAESPPEVNTKAGPFQVTNTNETPRVVSSFMRGSTERLPVKQVPATTTIGSSNCSSNSSNNQFLSNGARIFNGRRESEGNLVVKTAASLVNQNNKRPNEWHGSEQTANKLLKLSHRGYGGSVSSWNGQKSAMEKEVSDERKEELKRQTLNAGDAEMDRGHKKKTNSKLVLSRDNPGYNPFQESQNQRNTWTISSGSNGHSANGTSSYANRPHNKIYRMKHHNHKFYKNNNRFNRNGSGGNGSHFNNNHFQRRQMNK